MKRKKVYRMTVNYKDGITAGISFYDSKKQMKAMRNMLTTTTFVESVVVHVSRPKWREL